MKPFTIDEELVSHLDDLSEDELRAFAEMNEDPTNDEQIELYIYCCLMLFQESGSGEDLERAIHRAEGWISATPAAQSADRTRRSEILDLLSAWMHQDDVAQQEIRDIIQAIPSRPRGIQLPPIDDIGVQVQYLQARALDLSDSYLRSGCSADLDEAVRIADMAVHAAGSYIEPDTLEALGTILFRRCQETGSMDDLTRAIDSLSKAVAATIQGDPGHVGRLVNLSQMYTARFDQTGSTEDLDQAVKYAGAAKDVAPVDHRDRSLCLHSLGQSLSIQFETRGELKDLDDAIAFATEATELAPQGDPNYTVYLSNLADMLGRRFRRQGLARDLDRAVEAATKAVEATPRTHVDRPRCLNTLSLRLAERFVNNDSIEDLNRAIEVVVEALDATRPDHPGRAGWLNNLGFHLCERFKRTDSLEDLNRGIEASTEALHATPPGHPDRLACLAAMRAQLSARFDRTGSPEDLNGAIDIAVKMVDSMPQDHPRYAHTLYTLGDLYGDRFETLGTSGDLDRAIDLMCHAVAATPTDDPMHGSMSRGLGLRLTRRFDQSGTREDIDRAVETLDAAVDTGFQDNSDHALSLSTLAATLGDRFQHFDSMADLDRAIGLAAKGVDTMPQDHQLYGYCLERFADLQIKRFDKTGKPEDLDRAIKYRERAVKAFPEGHANHAACLASLANTLGKRWLHTESTDDKNCQLEAALGVWESNAAPSSLRIQQAGVAISFLASQQDWKGAIRLLKEVISLLPTLSPRFLGHTDMQNLLGEFPGLPSTAAAIALNAQEKPEDALRLLELSRGVIAGLLMDMRGDISDLRDKHPELADKFLRLRDELDLPLQSTMPSSEVGADMSSWESKLKRRRDATRDFDELADTIRALPGFSSFLQPPAAEDLMAAADPAPIVVVNVSSYRCDAFLVKSDEIKAVELPFLTEEEVMERVSDLQPDSDLTSLLEWLWDVICRPSLDALGFKSPVSGDTWPHVYWVPTGVLSQLPLHAAGVYTSPSKETVMDRVISSYASSVKALLHGRRQYPQGPVELPQTASAVLVAMQTTPCLSAGRLPHAHEEVDMLSKLCPSLQLNAVTPQRRKDDVLKHLKRCKIFHFAGHGQSDPDDPSKSCLLLEDWKDDPLTMGNLRDSRLQDNPPFLAYLSACSTGSNKVAALCDEGIHLVSAFQLAGFRHVVGTLWEVSDKHCVDVARVLYETLREEGFTDAGVSQGLHRAVRALRDGRAEEEVGARNAKLIVPRKSAARSASEYCWVPYVHFGA
ncbi:hypothetical protein ACJ41O_001652 [Fusarium nematophilum]